MSLVAPAIFGDFQSPGAVSYTPQWSGIMLQGAGLDPAVSTMLNGVAQHDIQPSAGALTAEEFGVGSDSASDGSATAPSARGSEFSGGVPMMAADMSGPTTETGAIAPICEEDEVAGKLRARGEFWNDPGAGLGGTRSPAQFPPGVFVGPIMLASPLRGLGPNGGRANLTPLGPAGSWCRPGREPFSLSSPIEDELPWIALSIVLGALVVIWLSRGARLPAI